MSYREVPVTGNWQLVTDTFVFSCPKPKLMNDQLSRTDFELTIDNNARRYLNDAANWGKFLAIAGLITSLLLLIGGIYLGTEGNNSYEYRRMSEDEKTAYQVGMIIGSVIAAAIFVFPNIMLLRYVGRIKTALATNNSEDLTRAFRAQRSMYIYIGILMILWLLIMVLGLAGGGLNPNKGYR